MTQAFTLRGGQVLGDDGKIIQRDLHLADGRVIAQPALDAVVLDMDGRHVMPGIVDVHGDAFEAMILPRPGAQMPLDLALNWVDAALISAGITTAFHGLTVSWEPGARSLKAARSFMTAWQATHPKMRARHHVQLRWDIWAGAALDDITGWLALSPTPSLAFNDHTSDTLEKIEHGETHALERWARKAGCAVEEYVSAAEQVRAEANQVTRNVERLARFGQDAGAVLLAHDEPDGATRHAHRTLGLTSSEFPLTPQTARAAIDAGEPVIMGAPNVLLGGSHKGMVGAESLVRQGLCTVLASDYLYPSLFHAIERLVQQGALSMAQAWDLIAANPARAMALMDRGNLEPGQLADVVVVQTDAKWAITDVFVKGRHFPQR